MLKLRESLLYFFVSKNFHTDKSLFDFITFLSNIFERAHLCTGIKLPSHTNELSMNIFWQIFFAISSRSGCIKAESEIVITENNIEMCSTLC